MENKLTQELLEKAKQAKIPEEIAALAKENGAELTAEEANTYFAMLNTASGELADDELDSVAGGGKCGTIYKDRRPVVFPYNICELWRCEVCHKKDEKGHYCSEHGGAGFCMTCDSSRSEGGLLLCYHPQRYDN